MARRAEYLGPEKRRPLVLDAAERIFSDGGFADASMQAIADRAQISKAVLYDCFPGGKQEIYYEMVTRLGDRFIEDMLAVVERTNLMPLRDGIFNFTREFHDWVDANPEGFAILFGDGGSSDPEIASRTMAARFTFVEKMGERTRQIMESGGMTFQPIHNLFGLAILTMAEATARWRKREPSLDRDLLIKMSTQLLMKGFEGVAPGQAWREAVDDGDLPPRSS
jgi:AcrR family transcriptional regulator